MGILYLKYIIRKYTINFFKKLAKNTNKKIVDLEITLKHFEKDYENYPYNAQFIKKFLMETFSVSKMQKTMFGENYYIFPALKIKKLVLVGKIL